MPSPLRRRLVALLGRVGVEVEPLVAGAVLIRRRGSAALVPARSERGALVVHRGRGRKEWFRLERQLAHHMVNQHVAAILRLYRVNCVLDVGANRGQYAKSLRLLGYHGQIHSFEPVPGVFEVLAAAAAKDPKWTVHRMALGRADGELEMNMVPGTLSSFLPSSEFGSNRYTRLNDTVVATAEVRRLDGMLDDLLRGIEGPRPYLKMDTQGFDLEAFAGLGERAGELVGLQSEVALLQIYDGMPRLPEALAVYEDAGFEVSAFYPVTRHARTGRVLEFDCVMVRADAVRRTWPDPTPAAAVVDDAAGG